ncbi:MAG: aminopeptidase [Anaerolineae bacterium]|nr:aminopeptidase [Anaerolineae bacterium]
MDNRVFKMAQVLINYSTAVQPGDRVLIRSTSPAAEPLCQALYAEALRAGGLPSVYIHMSQEDPIALETTGNLDLLSYVNPMLKLMYEEAEVVIRIDAFENTRNRSAYPLDRQKARAKAHSDLIDIQMERQAAKTLRRCTTQYPTFGYAQTAGMSLRQYEDFLFGACKVDAPDPIAAWREISRAQERLITWLNGKQHVHVRGDNIDLQMSIAGRVFKNADGTENFPDGEIFTGPVEDSVNGWVRFTYPAFYEGNEVKGAELEFKDGLVINARADANEAFLIAKLDTDAGSRRLGEFAIGTNRDVQQFTGSILFDEKIGGTVHMAVGQGYAETGSVNRSSVHWDMICDMRQGGEILVDGELFYRDGEVVI